MTQDAISSPPIARKEHKETVHHGTALVDDYAWLRNKENPEVTAFLEAENAYAESVMAPLAGLRAQLYDEMLSHIKQTDDTVPFRDGSWWYYSRTEEGRQYAIYCRKHGSPSGPERRRRSHPRWKCAGRRPRLLRNRRHRYLRRRSLDCLHDRHHRLPPIHPPH